MASTHSMDLPPTSQTSTTHTSAHPTPVMRREDHRLTAFRKVPAARTSAHPLNTLAAGRLMTRTVAPWKAPVAHTTARPTLAEGRLTPDMAALRKAPVVQNEAPSLPATLLPRRFYSRCRFCFPLFCSSFLGAAFRLFSIVFYFISWCRLLLFLFRTLCCN